MKISYIFLLTIIGLILLSNPTTIPPHSVHSSETPPANQLNKIIDALNGAGEFSGWAKVLSSLDPPTLPLNATMFIPINDAIAKNAISAGKFVPDTFLIRKHILPERLTFKDLQNHPVSSKLQTLLPNNYILVANDSANNVTVDGTRITHPDFYQTGSLSVHGVKNVLEYEVVDETTLGEELMNIINYWSTVGEYVHSMYESFPGPDFLYWSKELVDFLMY